MPQAEVQKSLCSFCCQQPGWDSQMAACQIDLCLHSLYIHPTWWRIYRLAKGSVNKKSISCTEKEDKVGIHYFCNNTYKPQRIKKLLRCTYYKDISMWNFMRLEQLFTWFAQSHNEKYQGSESSIAEWWRKAGRHIDEAQRKGFNSVVTLGGLNFMDS